MPIEFNYELTVNIKGVDVHFEGDIKEILFDLLWQTGPMTRGELHKATGIARTTLYDALVKLWMSRRIVRKSSNGVDEDGLPKRGRPFVYWSVK